GSEREFFSRRQKRRQKTGSPYTRSGRRTIPPHEPPQSDFRCRNSDCCVGISYDSTQFHPFSATRILNITWKAVPLMVPGLTSRIAPELESETASPKVAKGRSIPLRRSSNRFFRFYSPERRLKDSRLIPGDDLAGSVPRGPQPLDTKQAL